MALEFGLETAAYCSPPLGVMVTDVAAVFHARVRSLGKKPETEIADAVEVVFIASLKLTEIVELESTPVVPFAGVTKVTVGGVVSADEPPVAAPPVAAPPVAAPPVAAPPDPGSPPVATAEEPPVADLPPVTAPPTEDDPPETELVDVAVVPPTELAPAIALEVPPVLEFPPVVVLGTPPVV